MKPVTAYQAVAGCVMTRWMKANVAAPTGWVGSCADNAAAEGIFGMLKRERVNRRRYYTHAEARTDIFDYIERFYNPRMQRKLKRLEDNEIKLNSRVRENGT
jgi:putative transposase